MRLLRHGAPGFERPGLLDAFGRIRDLSAHALDVGGNALLPASIARLAAIDHARLPLVEAGVRLGPCVGAVRKLVRLQGGGACPELNLQAPSALAGANDAVKVPAGSSGVHCEAKLAIVLGRAGRGLRAADALSHVAGYCLLAELEAAGTAGPGSARQHHDGFAPLGPWLATPDELPAFDVAQAVAYVSRCMSLQPGDVLSVALPDGPIRRLLTPGETWAVAWPGLGEQHLQLVAADEPVNEPDKP